MRKVSRSGLPTLAGLSGLANAAMLALGVSSPPVIAAPTAVKAFLQPAVTDLGVASPSATKTITEGLALRNPATLTALLDSQVDPTSHNFRKFLTPDQFAAQFGQPAATVTQVAAYLQSQGFSVLTVHSNNLMITVRGTNAQIASTFGTSIYS